MECSNRTCIVTCVGLHEKNWRTAVLSQLLSSVKAGDWRLKWAVLHLEDHEWLFEILKEKREYYEKQAALFLRAQISSTNEFTDAQTSFFPTIFALTQNAACEYSAALRIMSQFQVRNSDVIFLDRLYLSIFPPPTSPLSLSSGRDYYDGSQMIGNVSVQWRQHLKEACEHCWLTHSPDVSVMVIILEGGEVGEQKHLSTSTVRLAGTCINELRWRNARKHDKTLPSNSNKCTAFNILHCPVH